MYPKGMGYSIPRGGVLYPEGSASRALRCAWHAITSVLSTLGRYMTDIGSEVDSYGAWYKTDMFFHFISERVLP